MSRLLIPCTAIALLLGTSQASLGEGALAVDKNDVWSFGMSWNHSNQNAADHDALNVCRSVNGSFRCEVVLRTSGSCLAYAIDDRHASGWAINWQLVDAQLEALGECESVSNFSCRVLFSECDGTPADLRASAGPGQYQSEFPAPARSLGGIIRSGPGLNYQRVGSLPEYEPISLLERYDSFDGYNWFLISYRGSEGYQWGGIICSEGIYVEGAYEVC